jgi:hypothetical protein
MIFYILPKEEVGSLYWRQLSLWGFSDKENIDVFSYDGFHYELMIVTAIIDESRRKVRNVKIGEITKNQLSELIPEKGHNWSRIMGNKVNLV